MTPDGPSVLAIVVADDGVEAGMLALDLVQAGLDAHAAADGESAISQLRELLAPSEGGEPPAIIAAYHDLRQASVLSRRLVSAGLPARFVAVVGDRDRRTAESEAALLGWAGVVPRPPDIDALAGLLRARAGAQEAPASDLEDHVEGRLGAVPTGELIARMLREAARERRHADAVLQLDDGRRAGQLAVVDGEIVHALADADSGRHALERICCWHRGDWRITYTRYQGPRSLHGPSDGMLAAALEYARRVAVARESVPHRNAVCTVRWEWVRPLPVVAEAMFHRIASGVVLERALDGDGDDELEAYAALASRIRRGAVIPHKSAVVTRIQPGRGAGRETGKQTVNFGSSGYSMVPGMRVTAPEQIRPAAAGKATIAYDRLPASAGRGTMRLSAARRTPVEEREQDALTRRIDPTDLPRDLPDIRNVPDLPATRRRHQTPSSPILPARLPDYELESDGVAASPVGPPVVREAASSVQSTGWFGLNVSTGHGEQGAAVARIVEPIAPVPSSSTVTETVSNLAPHRARPRKSTSEIDEALSSWTGDYAPTEKAISEVSASFRLSDLELDEPPPPSRGWTIGLVVIALAVATAGTWMSSGPSIDQVGSEPPMMHTYRSAVKLIDRGRRAEAMAVLIGLQDQAGRPKRGLPVEALLQLAVLEIEQGRYVLGRAHLERYLDSSSALYARRAKALYAHVFGKRPPQQ